MTRLVERIVANDECVPPLDHDSVKRFARPDIAPVIKQLWPVYKSHSDARDLLLRLIWQGGLIECADIAAAAVAQNESDRYARIMAGRAFVATADDDGKKEYANFVISKCRALPNPVIWDAVEALFPAIITVDDLLRILGTIDITDQDGGVGFRWQAHDLIARIRTSAELKRLLVGLSILLDPEPDTDRAEADDRRRALLSGLAAAAYYLLRMLPNDIAPDYVIDAAARIGRHHRYQQQRIIRKRDGNFEDELRKTTARRRLAFWRVAKILRGDHTLQGKEMEHIWQMEILGWRPGLLPEDVSWLLDDAVNLTRSSEKRLGINAALHVWNQAGKPDALLSSIETSALTDPVLKNALDAWMNPPSRNPALIQQEHELQRLQREGNSRRSEIDQSWIEFANDMRANPALLRDLNPPSDKGVDPRLYNLYKLLRSATSGRSRYGIDSVAPIEPMVGPEVASALRDGLIRHWRGWAPTRKSRRKSEDLNRIFTMDTMGIAGITLDSVDTNWVNGLTSELAERATVYATLELNGFPKWITDLSSRWPEQVRSVLTAEIIAELDEPHRGNVVLCDVADADEITAALMVSPMIRELEARPHLDAAPLTGLIDIAGRASAADQKARLLQLTIKRFNNSTSLELKSLYLFLAFRLDSDVAVQALIEKIDSLGDKEQTTLVQYLLPHLFGGRFSDRLANLTLSHQVLEQLVRLAFRTIRFEDDNQHQSGEVYRPDARDDAEGARSAAFKKLSSIPGRATFNTLLAFAEDPDFPISPRRLREIARSRAGEDSEFAPWPPREAHAFEERSELRPQTSNDLQRLLIGRLADIQHALLHDDFAQGSTLAALPNEKEVQIWMADRLQTVRGRSYSIEREPHVAAEKEPDIRARAEGESRVSLEIKVAESWSLTELEEALSDQLCGRYLRARGGRHGILLLVHQKPRALGWVSPDRSRHLDFDEVVGYLRMKAKEIAGAAPDSPQPEIAVIDVSTCASSKSKSVDGSRE